EAGAAVAVGLVAIVAGLTRVDDAVAAARWRDEHALRGAAGRAGGPVVALLSGIELAVAASLGLAGRGASITRDHVAVVALLARIFDAVAAAREGAVVVATVAVDLIAVVALLAGGDLAIAADPGGAGVGSPPPASGGGRG